MECSRVKALLSDYLDGMLDSPSAGQVEGHLAGCPRCRQQLDALKTLVGELNRLGPVKAPRDLLDQIHERLVTGPRRNKIIEKLFFPLQIKIPLQLAATALMAVIIIGVIAIENKKVSIRSVAQPSIAPSVADQKPAAKQLSRRARKIEASPVAEQTAADRKESPLPPVVLALIVKTGSTEAVDEVAGFQKALSAPSAGKAADAENRSISHFSAPRPAAEMPARDTVEGDAPGASLSTDRRQREEKNKMNIMQTRHRVEQLVTALAGNVLTRKDAPQQPAMDVTVPAGRYNEFVEQLGHIAPFQTPPPDPPAGQTPVRVEIRFITPD